MAIQRDPTENTTKDKANTVILHLVHDMNTTKKKFDVNFQAQLTETCFEIINFDDSILT